MWEVGFPHELVDADQLTMFQRFAQGTDLSPDAQALDAIREVGPGAHFLGCAHTRKNFATAMYCAPSADNNSYEQWLAEGGLDAAQRANRTWKKLLADYEDPGLDPAIDAALKDYMARRKAAMPDQNYY